MSQFIVSNEKREKSQDADAPRILNFLICSTDPAVFHGCMVKAVEGTHAHVRISPDSQWQAISAGDALPEDSQVRIGPDTKVVFETDE